MGQKLTWLEKINIGNIIVTILLSLVTLVISYNSYKISINTYNNSESLNRLNDRQSEFEFKNSILSLINISSMLQQTESNNPNIAKCLKAFNEIKAILEAEIKNSSLIKRSKLADLWSSLLVDVNFEIKFFEQGLKPNSIIDKPKEKVIEIEKKCSDLFEEFSKTDSPKTE